MKVTARDLRLDEREECLNLWCTVWPGENSRTYFERYFYGDVEWLPYYTQVAECDGKLVSAVHICKRTVSCGDFILTMGGIANVATLPEYRGRGYNAACLTRAIEIMEADAMDFSLLFTGINAYYRKFGFVDLRRVRTSVWIRPDLELKPGRYAVRSAVSKDMPAIRKIYETFNQDRPIAVRRSEAYWRDWMRFDPNQPPTNLLVACDASESVAGYVYSGVFNSAVPYDADDGAVRIIELCVGLSSPDEEEVVTRCLLNKVIDGLPRSQNRTLVMEIAVTPALTRVLTDIAGESGIEQTETTTGMARLLHKDSLLNSIIICSNERWRNTGSPLGKLAVETPYGRALLDSGGSLPRITDRDAESFENVIALSQSELFRLLFGSGVANSHEVESHGGSAELLAALFPPRNMVYWGVDGF